MNKEFVPYQEALELKELGFDEPCFGYYLANTLFISNDIVYNSTDIPVIKAPLYQQAFRWFEENYSLFVDIRTDTTPNEILGFDYYLKSWKFPPIHVDVYMSKEEGHIKVINRMIYMANKEKQKEVIVELMNIDISETKNKK